MEDAMRGSIQRTVAGTLTAAAVATVALGAHSGSADEDQVRAVLNEYFAGHATGDGSHYAKIFHPNMKLYYVKDGKYAERSRDDYIAGATGKPADDEAKRRREIALIDITGDAATAKLVLHYPTVTFTDYMSLLKIDGEWKIVAKTFTADRKAP
jgi:hypothetical protein